MKEVRLKLCYFFILGALFSQSLYAAQIEQERLTSSGSPTQVKLIMVLETKTEGTLYVKCQDTHLEIPLHNTQKGIYLFLQGTPFASKQMAASEIQCQFYDLKGILRCSSTYGVALDSPLERINIFQTFPNNNPAIVIIPNFNGYTDYSYMFTQNNS